MQSSYEYIDGSIKFNNVYIINNSVVYLTIDDISIPTIYKWPHTYPLSIIVKKFDCLDKLNNFKQSLNISQHIDIGAIGDNLWYGNIGHALFDGFYPLYLAMIKFGYIEQDFVYCTYNWTNYKTFSTEFIEKFTGNNIINLTQDKTIYFNTLFSGFGTEDSATGNCVINEKYMIYGQEEYNALQLFKERIFKKYNLIFDKPINPIPKIIIIHNKRFSSTDVNILNQLVDHFKSIADIKYINWYHDYKTFYQQLQELENTDIQITGPGTGMLYCPFLKNGAVNVNLGYMECTQSNTARPNIYIDKASKEDYCFPGWMEQALCSGSNYINSIYYDRLNFNNLELKELVKLVNQAITLLGKTTDNNWNIDALIFKEYCKNSGHGQKITKFLTGMAFFIELFINEHPKAIPDFVDIKLLRQLKNNFNYPQKYSIVVGL